MTRNRILTVLILLGMSCVFGRNASAATLATAFGGLTFNQATSIQQVRGNPSRWFVAERGGLIKTFSTNDLAAGASVALNISSYLQYTDKAWQHRFAAMGHHLDCALAEFQDERLHVHRL